MIYHDYELEPKHDTRKSYYGKAADHQSNQLRWRQVCPAANTQKENKQ